MGLQEIFDELTDVLGCECEVKANGLASAAAFDIEDADGTRALGSFTVRRQGVVIHLACSHETALAVAELLRERTPCAPDKAMALRESGLAKLTVDEKEALGLMF